jgi:hypothetical protein
MPNHLYKGMTFNLRETAQNDMQIILFGSQNQVNVNSTLYNSLFPTSFAQSFDTTDPTNGDANDAGCFPTNGTIIRCDVWFNLDLGSAGGCDIFYVESMVATPIFVNVGAGVTGNSVHFSVSGLAIPVTAGAACCIKIFNRALSNHYVRVGGALLFQPA